MILKSIHPIADLDLDKVLFFTTKKLVTYNKSTDKDSQQNLVVAKYSDQQSYILHNFGPEALRAKNVKNTLQRLLSQVCPNKEKWTVNTDN